MAKIKFGSVITDSRGSIGGHTFKWSRWGNILTNKAKPRQSQTARQTFIQANFATLSKRWWTELTASERTAWRELAAANPKANVWGDEYALTGLAYFIRINQRLHAAGLTQTNTAPANQTVTSPVTATITASAPSTIAIDFTATPVPTDHITYLFATPPLSPGRLNLDGDFYFLGAGALAQTSPWNLAALYAARFGPIITGRQYAALLAFLNTDNGALSPALLTTTIAT